MAEKHPAERTAVRIHRESSSRAVRMRQYVQEAARRLHPIKGVPEEDFPLANAAQKEFVRRGYAEIEGHITMAAELQKLLLQALSHQDETQVGLTLQMMDLVVGSLRRVEDRLLSLLQVDNQPT